MRLNRGEKGVFFRFFLLLSGLFILGCSEKPQENSQSSDTLLNRHEEKSYKKVLVVHSYFQDYKWTQTITRGVSMVLNTHNVDVQIFYMDTKHHPSQEWMVRKSGEAMDVIGQWNPDVVITADDNAQEYVGRKLAKEGRIPVVFCGVNANPDQYGYPTPTATGVLERPHFRESVSFLKKILGKEKPLRIVVMSGCSKTTDFAFDKMKTQVNSEAEVLNWYKPATWQEWKQAVQECQSRADAIAIYTYHAILPDPNSTQSMDPEEVISWTVQNSRIPVIGFLPFAAEDGSLCGVLESGLEQGKIAGQMVMEILQGRQAGSIGIQTGRTIQPMLNLNTARKLGIDVSPETIREADILVETTENKMSL
jgi:ABC-type uncharacterized transport system substrate-binding protein